MSNSEAVEFDPGDGIELWLVDLDAASETAEWQLLDDSEKLRANRFVFERDRSRYVAAHAAVRRLLATRIGQPAATLRFHEGPNGKPYLTAAPRCSFNLSHCENVGLIGIAAGLEIGVDVEILRPVPDALDLAQANFTSAEQAELRHSMEGTAKAAGDLTFLRGWTRKEACLKAIGSGLSIHPSSFETGLGVDRRDVLIETADGAASVEVRTFSARSTLVAALATTR